MRNFYFLQIPLGTDAAYLPQAVGTIWSYCNQFEEVRKRNIESRGLDNY